MKHPILITIDGFEGAGKTTQAHLLRDRINHNVRIVEELPELAYSEMPVAMLGNTLGLGGNELVALHSIMMLNRRQSGFNRGRLFNDTSHYFLTMPIVDFKQKQAGLDVDSINIMTWFYPYHIIQQRNADLINLFHTYVDFPPTISFWLNSSHQTLVDRQSSRHDRHRDSCTVDADLAWLSDKMPTFHVLNGALSENEVAKQIDEKIKQLGLRM